MELSIMPILSIIEQENQNMDDCFVKQSSVLSKTLNVVVVSTKASDTKALSVKDVALKSRMREWGGRECDISI